MLTEPEYLNIAERYQRASMGDGTVMPQLLQIDIARLLADWREWERRCDALREQIDEEMPQVRRRLETIEMSTAWLLEQARQRNATDEAGDQQG